MEPYYRSGHDWYESNQSRDGVELEMDITQRKGGSMSRGKAEEKQRSWINGLHCHGCDNHQERLLPSSTHL